MYAHIYRIMPGTRSLSHFHFRAHLLPLFDHWSSFILVVSFLSIKSNTGKRTWSITHDSWGPPYGSSTNSATRRSRFCALNPPLNYVGSAATHLLSARNCWPSGLWINARPAHLLLKMDMGTRDNIVTGLVEEGALYHCQAQASLMALAGTPCAIQ